MKYFTEISRHAFFFPNERFFTDPPRTKASMWRTPMIHYVDEQAAPYPESGRRALLVGIAAFVVSGLLFFCVALIVAVRVYIGRLGCPDDIGNTMPCGTCS
jgi:hypothetical protein